MDKPEKAVGHLDDFKNEAGALDYEALKEKHVDGATGFVFNTEEDYVAYKDAQAVLAAEAAAKAQAEAEKTAGV